MTATAFKLQMHRLSGLKFAPSTYDTHWEALSDLSDEQLHAAVSRATRECDEFPSPKMLRAFVTLEARRVNVPEEDRGTDLSEPVVIPFPLGGRDLRITREWRYYCDTCQDGGWQSFQCDGHSQCGRDRQCPYPHKYVKRCACWETNPALIRKREKAAQSAHQRAEKGER